MFGLFDTQNDLDLGQFISFDSAFEAAVDYLHENYSEDCYRIIQNYEENLSSGYFEDILKIVYIRR